MRFTGADKKIVKSSDSNEFIGIRLKEWMMNNILSRNFQANTGHKTDIGIFSLEDEKSQYVL